MKTPPPSRRGFITRGTFGLGAMVASAGRLDAQVGPAEGVSERLSQYVGALKGFSSVREPVKWEATGEIPEVPDHRSGAPFRAKVSPPGAPGLVLLIGGRIWNLKTRLPLRNVVVEVWHADADGRHDLDPSRKPLSRDVFLNRARLIADETGYYEFETIKPGPFRGDDGLWRASRIHIKLQYPGFRPLVTEMFFRGDPHHGTDPTFRPALAIDLKERKAGSATFHVGWFDIVLEPLS